MLISGSYQLYVVLRDGKVHIQLYGALKDNVCSVDTMKA